MNPEKANPYKQLAKNPRLPSGQIFTVGAFCRPEVVTKDGHQMWQWVISEFVDESYNARGEFVDPNELAENTDGLLKPEED